MNTKIAAGAAAGLIGGVAFDIVMRVMHWGTGSMIGFGAASVHASRPAIGWIVYPVYGVLLGLLFGWMLQHQALDDIAAALWGGLYGVAWWILAGLIVLPVLGDVWPFSVTAVDQAREVAFPLLIGHVVYGIVLGLAWVRLARWTSLHHAHDASHLAGPRAA